MSAREKVLTAGDESGGANGRNQSCGILLPS